MKTCAHASTFVCIAILALAIASSSAHEGTYLEFHGGTDHANMPHNSSLIVDEELTIEAWVNYYGGGGIGPRIIEIINNFNLHLDPDTDRLGFWLFSNTFPSDNGWTRIYDAGPLPLNEWIHVAGTWDGGTMRLFINGALISSTVFTGPLDNQGGADLKIGNGWTLIDGINGGIDEVRFSSVARYISDFIPPVSHDPDSWTVGLWHFDEDSGAIAFDSGDNANHADIYGASWASDPPVSVQEGSISTIKAQYRR